MGVAEGGGWGLGAGGGGGGRWVQQASDVYWRATLDPFPCQLSPGGDVLSAYDLGWIRVIVASGVSRRG